MKLHLHSSRAAAVFVAAVLLATCVFGLSAAATPTSRKHSIAASPAAGAASSSSPSMSSFFPSPSLGSYPALPPAPAQGPSSGGFLGSHSEPGARRGSLLLVVMTVLLGVL